MRLLVTVERFLLHLHIHLLLPPPIRIKRRKREGGGWEKGMVMDGAVDRQEKTLSRESWPGERRSARHSLVAVDLLLTWPHPSSTVGKGKERIQIMVELGLSLNVLSFKLV